MLSISIFGSVLPPMSTRPDPRSEAVTFLGLLRHNEDRLVERTKSLVKRDRIFIQEMFSSQIDQWTPFHACTLRGARKLIKVALKTGVDVDLQMGSPDGLPGRCTPLHLAAYRGDVSIIQLLIQNGADMDKKDDANHSPLYYAVTRRNTLAAKKLLKYGADASDLSIEERVFYRDDIDKGSANNNGGGGSHLLCIPHRTRNSYSSKYKEKEKEKEKSTADSSS